MTVQVQLVALWLVEGHCTTSIRLICLSSLHVTSCS
jgi:hypothetical protein